jgi:hypothetical protein
LRRKTAASQPPNRPASSRRTARFRAVGPNSVPPRNWLRSRRRNGGLECRKAFWTYGLRGETEIGFVRAERPAFRRLERLRPRRARPGCDARRPSREIGFARSLFAFQLDRVVVRRVEESRRFRVANEHGGAVSPTPNLRHDDAEPSRTIGRVHHFPRFDRRRPWRGGRGFLIISDSRRCRMRQSLSPGRPAFVYPWPNHRLTKFRVPFMIDLYRRTSNTQTEPLRSRADMT